MNENKQNISDAALKIAADWWFDRIEGGRHDNGASDPSSMFAGFLADKLAAAHPVDSDQREQFAKAFATAFAEDKYGGRSTGCDYGPSGILAEAMESCEINTSRAPWKTHMWIDDRGVGVSGGYAAPHERLCDAAGVRPTVRYTAHYMYDSEWSREHGDTPEPSESGLMYSQDEIDTWAKGNADSMLNGVERVVEERLVDGDWIVQ